MRASILRSTEYIKLQLQFETVADFIEIKAQFQGISLPRALTIFLTLSHILKLVLAKDNNLETMDTDAGEASGSGYVGRDTEKDCDDGFVDEDELFDELENEDIPRSIREARMNQMKREAEAARAMEDQGLGLYTEIEKEEDVLKMTTTIPRIIIHFYHTDFRRCSIMDKHLKILAEQYRDVKFAKVCVDIVPFFVTKLQIKVLPAVLVFIDGIVTDRVVGFDDLGNTDSFTTAALEKRIAQSGIIKPQVAAGSTNKTIFGFDRRRDDSSDEDY